MQDHEHRDALAARGIDERRVEFGADDGVHGAADVGGNRGTRTVEGERERAVGCAGQGARPVRQLPAAHTVRVVEIAEQSHLPVREIAVPQRQRLPLWCDSAGSRRVRSRSVTEQRGHGGSVHGDVVRHDDENPLGRLRPQQCRAQWRPRRQVERPGCHPSDPSVELVAGQGLVDDRDLDVPAARDRLTRLVRVVRPQRFVPIHHVADGRGERARVEGFAEPDDDRHDVVGTVGFGAMEQPQPALCRSDRHRLRVGPDEFGTGGGGPGVDRAGQRGERGRLEHGTRRDVPAERLRQASGDLDGSERMPADCEEPGVDVDTVPEDVGDYRGDDRLRAGERATAGRVREFACEFGQRPEVGLAVARRREQIQYVQT